MGNGHLLHLVGFGFFILGDRLFLSDEVADEVHIDASHVRYPHEQE
jgi:hypothetical protein